MSTVHTYCVWLVFLDNCRRLQAATVFSGSSSETLKPPKQTNKSTSTTCCSWTNLLLNHQAQTLIRKKEATWSNKNLALNFDRFHTPPHPPFYLLSLTSLREVGKWYWGVCGKERCSSGLYSPGLHPLPHWGRTAAIRGLDKLREPCQHMSKSLLLTAAKGKVFPAQERKQCQGSQSQCSSQWQAVQSLDTGTRDPSLGEKPVEVPNKKTAQQQEQEFCLTKRTEGHCCAMALLKVPAAAFCSSYWDIPCCSEVIWTGIPVISQDTGQGLYVVHKTSEVFTTRSCRFGKRKHNINFMMKQAGSYINTHSPQGSH